MLSMVHRRVWAPKVIQSFSINYICNVNCSNQHCYKNILVHYEYKPYILNVINHTFSICIQNPLSSKLHNIFTQCCHEYIQFIQKSWGVTEQLSGVFSYQYVIQFVPLGCQLSYATAYVTATLSKHGQLGMMIHSKLGTAIGRHLTVQSKTKNTSIS